MFFNVLEVLFLLLAGPLLSIAGALFLFFHRIDFKKSVERKVAAVRKADSFEGLVRGVLEFEELTTTDVRYRGKVRELLRENLTMGRVREWLTETDSGVVDA